MSGYGADERPGEQGHDDGTNATHRTRQTEEGGRPGQAGRTSPGRRQDRPAEPDRPAKPHRAAEAHRAAPTAPLADAVVTWIGPVVDGQVTVVLGGAATLRVAAGPWRALGLSRGDPVGPEASVALRAAETAAAAVRAALALLAARPRTRGGVGQALARRFPPAAVGAALDEVARWCEDDAAFARRWLEEQAARHPGGADLLAAGLVRQGLPDGEARRLVDEWLRGHDERDMALRAARQDLRRVAGLDPQRARRRLSATLARRGFSQDVIEAVVRTALADEPHAAFDDAGP